MKKAKGQQIKKNKMFVTLLEQYLIIVYCFFHYFLKFVGGSLLKIKVIINFSLK